MKKVNSLLMYALAGAMIFSACNKDDDEDDATSTKDTTKPTATLTAPVEGSETDAATVSIDGKVADNKALASYKLTVTNGGSSWDTTIEVSGTSADVKYSVATAGWAAGASSVSLMATDAAGNASAEVTNNFTMKDPKPVDNEDPKVNSVTVNIPVDGTLSNGFANKVTFNVSDNIGLEKIEIEVYDKDNSQSIWTKTIMKADMTDNKAYNQQLEVKFQKTFGLNTAGEWRIKATDEAGNEANFTQAVTLNP